MTKKAKSKKIPKITNTKMCEIIVIESGKLMREKEVLIEMHKRGRHAIRMYKSLLRACRIDATTRKYLPNKEFARLELILDPKGKRGFRAKPEFTRWMIPCKSNFLMHSRSNS